jgi:hypothetical protein
MLTFVRRQFILSALALSAVTALASGPAHAATSVATKAYSADQLMSLPPETTLSIHGKTITLGALRSAHQALLARFQAAGSLKSLLTFGPLVRVPVKGAVASPVRLAVSTAAGPAMKHVPSAVPNGPLDYVAVCSQHSVCVFIPAVPADDITLYSVDGSHFEYLDPLLTPSVCQADGGYMSTLTSDSGTIPDCVFAYPMSATQSAFPGSPPAMQTETALSCGQTFATQTDPMGAAVVSIAHPNSFSSSATQSVACAIDMYVPPS